jgi:uncharacterized protein
VSGDEAGAVTFLLIIFFIGRGFIILQTEKIGQMSGFYSIPLAGLKETRYTYEFEIGDDFFQGFEATEIKRGRLKAVVVLQKCSTHVELDIMIDGQAEVTCDRCLEELYIPVSCRNRLIVRQGREWDDSDPDMITMPLDEHDIDLSQFFYEYIHLALPLKRIHPDDSEGHSTCNPEMIRKLGDHLISVKEHHDPRWDELEKLTRNN